MQRHHTTEAIDAITPFEEHDRAALRSIVVSEAGPLPAGAIGTIISVYDHGAAYCVEFTLPFASLVIVKHGDLASTPDRRADAAHAPTGELPGRA